MKKNLFFASLGGANTPPAKKPWSSLQNIQRTMVMLFVMLFSVGAWAADPTLAIGTTAQTSSTFLGAYTKQGITLSSTSGYSSGAVQLGNTPSAYDAHYFEVLSSSDIIDSISFLISGNGSNKSIQAPVFAWENTATGNTADTYALLDAVTVTANSYDAAKWFTYDLTAVDVKCARIYRTTKGISSINPEYTGSSTALGSGQTIKIYGIKVYTHANCTDPEAHLAFTKSTAYVGEQFSYDYGSKSGGDLSDSYTLNGVPAVKGTDYTFTSGNITVLKAGQFVMHMITAAVGDYCAADLSDTILIYEATPVASVTVAGATEGYIGSPVALTATFDQTPNSIKWFVDGVEQAGATAATFNFTPAAAQTYSIVCKARNSFNDEGDYAESSAHSVTASKLCGELIKITATGNKDGNITGTLSGTKDVNMSSSNPTEFEEHTGYKLGGNGQYIGINSLSSALRAGDTAIVYVTTASANLQLFSDKGTTMIGEKIGGVVQGENKIVLNASATGQTAIYLYRADITNGGSNMNPYAYSLAVKRPCTESSDCSISALTIGGDAVSAEGKVFSKEFSSGDATTSVEIAFTIHALASASPASGFSMDVPAVGDAANSRTITVTAEDGTQDTYTVTLSRSASLSDDATLSALAVEGFTLDPVFDAATTAYTISKAYGSDNPALSLVSATKNYDAASVADAVYDGNDIVITVTAEDGVATKEYRITVEEAAAPRALNEVIMSNKYMAYVLDGDPTKTLHAFYLNGEAEPSIQSVNVSEGASWAVNEGKLKVTGADAGFDEYPLDIVAVTPVEYGTDKITFDGSETWVKSGYGWDDTKKWKFSKTDNDYSREKSGKTHIEFFLPACDTVEIYESNTAGRDIRVYINGVQFGDKVNLAKNGTLKFAVKQENAFMLTIASAQTSGDGGVGALRMAKANVVDPTITFSNGVYTIDGAALDLSTLFTSNSDGAVTYSITAAGETGATLDGANFTATAAGEVTVRADQEAATGFNAAYATATITVSEPAAPVDPTITFNAGNYTVGAAALDLSTLFSTNSAGEVTYSIVDAGETGATLDGANFTATAAGTATVRASQAAAAGFNAKTADAVITVAAAPAEPEGTKLIVGGEINSAYYTTLASITDDASYTVESIEYTKQLVFNSNMNTFSGQTLAGRGNRLVAYDTKTNSTDIILRVYNKDASNARKLYYQIVQEGETAGEVQNVSVAKASGQEIVIPTIANSKNTRILFAVENVNLLICQIYAQENGTTLPMAGQAGYALAIPGRLGTNGATSIDGLSIKANSDIKFISGTTYAELRGTDGGQFIKFATTGAVRVQITTNNTSKFYVCNSATGGNSDSDTQYGGTKSTFNIDLAAAGTWYVLPVTGSTGSSTGAVQITKIAFAEPPVAYSVTYDKNGATGDAPVQADLYEGNKFNVASASGLVKDGYDFNGWLCSVDAQTYAAGDEYTMTAANVTFTAQWVEHVQSSDATLSALEVAGLTLSPAFDPATEAYTATLPFYASMPAVGDVTATKSSEYAAAPVVTIAANVISVSVKAENNDVKTYTITVNQEAAPAASSSINIEQYVLDNRKGNNESEGIALAQAMFTAANISYANINALDSLNDGKTNRNYAYLGAKIKSNGGYLEIAVPAEKSLKVKFGNIAADVAVMINGVAQDDHSKSTEIYELAAANELRVVRLSTTTSGTVVFKQIMIGEDIADVVLPYGIAIADGIENGAIAAAKWALPGDDVAVTVTPADGYVLENLIVNEEAQGAVTSFTMPSENVTISATFVASAPTPVDPVYTVVRDGLTPGYFYTMCLDKNVTAARGASFWKPAGYNDSSVELEEVVGELEAGIPYFFKATAATLEVVYGDDDAPSAGTNNGLVGSFTEEDIQAGAGNYILYDNKLYEVAATQLAKVGAYRAYINIGQINNVAPAPGMRRMAMPIQRGTATGIDAIEVGAELKKVVIDGQLYIVRDGRMYDVTGQLVR